MRRSDGLQRTKKWGQRPLFYSPKDELNCNGMTPPPMTEFDGHDVYAHVGSLPSSALIKVLARGANNLTVEVRATYVPGSDTVDARFLGTCRKMNECQHFLLGILSRLLMDKKVDRDLFTVRLAELGDDSDIGNSLKRALTSALRVVRSDSHE